MSAMYRAQPPTLLAGLTERLGPMGFVEVEPDDVRKAQGVRRLYRRKTWNTNRGVVVAAPPSRDLRAYAELMRASAGDYLGSSWWNQLGLQLVFEVAGEPPPVSVLQPLVDQVNSQGVLIQSVFAYDGATFVHTSARTWGQLVTGRFQDAIAATLSHLASPHTGEEALT